MASLAVEGRAKRCQAQVGWTRTGERNQDGRQIVADVKGEVATVRRIVQLRERGLTLRAIAAALQDEGRPTKAGGKWHASTVRNVLRRAESNA